MVKHGSMLVSVSKKRLFIYVYFIINNCNKQNSEQIILTQKYLIIKYIKLLIYQVKIIIPSLYLSRMNNEWFLL